MSLAEITGWGMAGGLAILTAALAHDARRRAVHVARCCHELRGPLTAARLGLALPPAGGSRAAAARSAAIEAELERAALIVEDLCAASGGRAAARPVGPRGRAPQLVDVERVAEEIVEARSALAAARGVELEAWLDGAVVQGDGRRLAQALGNLVDNAIRHGAGVVRVTTRGREDVVRIEVADDGPGLPAPVDEIVRRARHRRGRHGHGLVVAAEIAAAHGGRLLTAPAGRGARVVLELPRRADGLSVSI